MVNTQNNIKKHKKSGIARLFAFIKEFVDDVFGDSVGVYAAQATFYIILSSVPFIMILILCLKYFIDVDLPWVIRNLNRFLPEQFAVFLTDVVTEVFYRTQTTAVFSVAFLTLLWSSSKGTLAIYCGLNRIYGTTEKQSWLRMRILSFIYNILLVTVLLTSTVVLLFGNTVVSVAREQFSMANYFIDLIMQFRVLIFFVLFVLAFAALFTFMPQKKNKYRKQLCGAVVTSIGWLLASYGISIYITYFPGISYIYGSLTAIMLLMLWVFFCIYSLLMGAEINKHIENGYFRRIGMRIMRIRVKKRKKSEKNT